MDQNRNMEFMAIAMKYFPEAKERLDKAGIELSMDLLPHFMDLFQKVMQDAYELGKQDALK
ncbi:ComZ family protein [Peribacillus sp. SCS-26]|uniref:ComZ family protein n=1 Tax=Paraperibacillus marinus TaxID=3115295 RepID=UPI003906CF3E